MWRKLAAVSILGLAGCAGSYVPPVSLTASALGGLASVTVAEPGFTIPAKVVTSGVTSPVLVVPPTSPITSGNVTVTAPTGVAVNVPVKTGNVTEAFLAVPPPLNNSARKSGSEKN